MRYRELGNSGQNLSEIGLGTWAIGGGDWGMGWGDQKKEDSIDAILEALECGINWIDTAHAWLWRCGNGCSRGIVRMERGCFCCHKMRGSPQARRIT